MTGKYIVFHFSHNINPFYSFCWWCFKCSIDTGIVNLTYFALTDVNYILMFLLILYL